MVLSGSAGSGDWPTPSLPRYSMRHSKAKPAKIKTPQSCSLAGIKLIVSGQHREGTAAQAIVEVVDAARHLDPAALEGGAELVVQGHDFVSAVHAVSAVEIKRRIAHPLPWLGQHVSAGRRRSFGRREAREGFEQQCLRATAGGHAMRAASIMVRSRASLVVMKGTKKLGNPKWERCKPCSAIAM